MNSSGFAESHNIKINKSIKMHEEEIWPIAVHCDNLGGRAASHHGRCGQKAFLTSGLTCRRLRRCQVAATDKKMTRHHTSR